MFFPHPKPPPNEPNSKEAPSEPWLVTCSIIRTHHPMSPAAIHPILPPNGKGKGRINYYYYTRPWIHFFPTRNPRQMHPNMNKRPQHPFWWWLCLHMFTYPRLTQIYPLHAPPSHPAPTASKTPLPTLKQPYPPLLIYLTLPIGVTYCYMWCLGNLPPGC